MYYYGGYQGYGGYPNVQSGGCCNGNNGYGYGYGAAIILVLFILLAIIIGSRLFDNSNGCSGNCSNR